jgi:hypothetical protein
MAAWGLVLVFLAVAFLLTIALGLVTGWLWVG